jgi:hypothetical protein
MMILLRNKMNSPAVLLESMIRRPQTTIGCLLRSGPRLHKKDQEKTLLYREAAGQEEYPSLLVGQFSDLV